MTRRRGTPRPDPRAKRGPRPPSAAPPPPLRLASPPALATVLIAVGCVLAAITYRLYDTDFWQHLAVGRAIWKMHGVPTQQLWRWPSYGAPDVNESWGFSALIWPFWAAGGMWGLFVWRWITTLAAFGLGWATARRMGARGLTPLVAIVACAMFYRTRSQVRPETLVAVLMGLEIWILEKHRQASLAGGEARDPTPWLIVIAWVWANVHITYLFGLLILAAHLADAQLSAWNRKAASPRRLWWVMAAALAIPFVNPFGWRALWRPFEYALEWRHEPLFRSIEELQPIRWMASLATGLPLIVAGWPLLAIARAMRRGFDRAEALLCIGFGALLFSSQRMLSPFAIVATPYLARDLDDAVRNLRWPRWSAKPWARAALASGTCVAALVVTLRQPLQGAPGVGIEPSVSPVAACDWITAQNVRGRGFNYFPYGAYLLWRFWPERDRLPFVSIHPEDAPLPERELYWSAFTQPASWKRLDARYHFDWVLFNRQDWPLLDFLDADSSWVLVFLDDAASLFVRRGGALGPVAARFAYRELPAGRRMLELRSNEWGQDPTRLDVVRAELQRSAQDSPVNAMAELILAELALAEGSLNQARAAFERVLVVNPRKRGVHERLGEIALEQHRDREALREFEAERSLDPNSARLALRFGEVYLALGELPQARAWLERELTAHPDDTEARARLDSLSTPIVPH